MVDLDSHADSWQQMGEHLERKKGRSAFCTPLFRFKCCDSEKLVSDVGPISSPLYLSDCESYINFLLIDGNRRPCPAIVSANKSRMADRLWALRDRLPWALRMVRHPGVVVNGYAAPPSSHVTPSSQPLVGGFQWISFMYKSKWITENPSSGWARRWNLCS